MVSRDQADWGFGAPSTDADNKLRDELPSHFVFSNLEDHGAWATWRWAITVTIIKILIMSLFPWLPLIVTRIWKAMNTYVNSCFELFFLFNFSGLGMPYYYYQLQCVVIELRSNLWLACHQLFTSYRCCLCCRSLQLQCCSPRRGTTLCQLCVMLSSGYLCAFHSRIP